MAYTKLEKNTTKLLGFTLEMLTLLPVSDQVLLQPPERHVHPASGGLPRWPVLLHLGEGVVPGVCPQRLQGPQQGIHRKHR